MEEFVHEKDLQRHRSQEKKKTPEAKRKRKEYKLKQKSKTKKAERKEGPSYQSNIGIDELEIADGDAEAPPKKRAKLTDDQTPFVCDVEGCQKRYARKGNLQNHKAKSHPVIQ